MNPPIGLFQFVIVFTIVANLIFLAGYTWLQPWWRDSIGITIAIESFLIIFALVPSALSLFLHFNRLTSVVSGWFDVGDIFLVGAVILWRAIAFQVTSKKERVKRLAELEAQRKHRSE